MAEDRWPEGLSIADARETYPTLWERTQELFPDLTYGELAEVVALVTDTCQSCWSASRACQCWNDC